MVSHKDKTGIWATIAKDLKATYIPELKLLKVVNMRTGLVLQADTYIVLKVSEWTNTIRELRIKYQHLIKNRNEIQKN